MTYIEEALAQRESANTAPLTSPFSRSAALGLILLQLSGPVASQHLDHYFTQLVRHHSDHVADTSQVTQLSIDASPLEIFGQLDRIYNYLLTQSKDLDDDSHKILYSNLWKLYD
jgi:hypothetical protein